MIRVVTAFAASALVCSLVGCSGHDASVGDHSGTSDQKLQTKKDGTATGDGQTCSWEGTVSYDSCGSKETVPTYKLGEEFASIDGCNECACTTKGIMCTVRSCAGDPGTIDPVPPVAPPPPIACDASMRICKDGSPAKPLPDSCKQVCPEDYGSGGGAAGGGTACPALARICKDQLPAKQDPNTCKELCPEDFATDPPPPAPAPDKKF